MRQIDLYPFSGTGNTFLVARRMAEVFERHGVLASFQRLERKDPARVDLEHTLGLAFPVAGFSTYPFIWDFIAALPPAEGTPVFMIDTMAGYSGGMVGPLRSLLEKKGYCPIGALEIVMPANIWTIESDEAKVRSMIEKGLAQAEVYASDLLAGRARWPEATPWSNFMYRFSRSMIRQWRSPMNQLWFAPDIRRARCRNCGICVRLCPTRNIVLGKVHPVRQRRCELCLRCLAFCPSRAIRFWSNGPKRYRAPGIRPTDLEGQLPGTVPGGRPQ